jgi:hypothetical protein
MSYEEMSIGPSPCDEPCVSVGEENYMERGREECKRFIELVRKKLGDEPPGAYLKVKSNPHDFGLYYSATVYFDDSDEEARNYAFRCESEAPRTWLDDQPLQKKRYKVRAGLSCRIQVTVEAVSRHMAEVQAKAMVRIKAKEEWGVEVDDFDEVVADAQEIKEAALAPPQS